MANTALKIFDTQFDNLSQAEQFIELLYHCDHKSYAYKNYKISGIMNQKSCINKCALLPDDYSKDCWISLNLFTSGKQRIATNVRELTGFYFDLDKHDASKNKIDKAVMNSYKLLYSLVDKNILPEPTIVTKTGRGLGVYYIFNNSIAVTDSTLKQQKYYTYLYTKIADILGMHFNKTSLLEVDRVVVNDHTRIIRLPGTYNTAAGRYCSIASIGVDYFGLPLYYDLSTFKSYVDKYTMQITKKEVLKESKKVISFVGCTSPFLYNRVKQMEKLQYHFNMECINKRREYMCFIYYNSVKQIFPDPIERLETFNNNFISPLSYQELKHVVKSVDDNITETHQGYYKLTDNWIIDKLDLSEDELKVTLLGQSQRTIQREAAKEYTANKRKERDQKVLDLLTNTSNTYKEIALQLNISVSTVKRIAKDSNITRYTKDLKNEEDNTIELDPQNENKLVKTLVVVCKLFSYKKAHFLALCLLVCFVFDLSEVYIYIIDWYLRGPPGTLLVLILTSNNFFHDFQ